METRRFRRKRFRVREWPGFLGWFLMAVAFAGALYALDRIGFWQSPFDTLDYVVIAALMFAFACFGLWGSTVELRKEGIRRREWFGQFWHYTTIAYGDVQEVLFDRENEVVDVVYRSKDFWGSREGLHCRMELHQVEEFVSELGARIEAATERPVGDIWRAEQHA